MGSLKFAIGLEPPSLRILAGGLYFVFPSSALVLLDRVLKVLPFSLPDFRELLEDLL